MAVTILRTTDGNLDASDRASLDALVARLKSGSPKVLLHLHGGLVPRGTGEAIARRLSEPGKHSYNFPDDWEQIYVVWRTGAFETLENNWTDLFRNKRLYKILLKHLIGLAGKKLGIPTGAETRAVFDTDDADLQRIRKRLDEEPHENPFGDIDDEISLQQRAGRSVDVSGDGELALQNELELQLELDKETRDVSEDIAAFLAADAGVVHRGHAGLESGRADFGKIELEGMSPNLRKEIEQRPASGERAIIETLAVIKFLAIHGGRIAWRVLQRYRRKRDHGFYATVVEEFVREMYGDVIGAAIWSMMKADAAEHFLPGGLGTDLLNALTACQPQKLALTGHSAGSIWACQFLKELHGKPKLPDLRVALMAPAVRIDLFAEALGVSKDFVRDLRVFTMDDFHEARDPVLGEGKAFLYPSSLLYLISGILEEAGDKPFADCPILGMQRFLTASHHWLEDPVQIAAVQAALDYLANGNDRLVFSVTEEGSADGRRSEAKSHGSFDRDPRTLESVRHFVS